jgi:peptidoglycan/LPS O-acetylase OafA/YrhL
MATADQSEHASEGGAGRPASGSRLAGFDGLRAVAAFAILIYHASLFSPGFAGTTLWDVVIQLRSGVWIFFVISGFLLYRPHVAAHQGIRATPRVRSYAWSRVLRIFPAYIVALVILTYVVHETELQSIGAFLTQLGLLQIYSTSVFRDSFPLDIAWSLATELSFYVFLPFFAAGVAAVSRRIGVVRAEVGGLAIMVVVGIAWQITMKDRELQNLWLPNFFPVFAVGMGLAVAAAHLGDRAPQLRSFARLGPVCWALGFGVLILKGLAFPGDYGVAQGHAFAPQLYYTVFAFLMVLPCVLGAGSRSVVHRFVDTRVMIFLGTISYGVFLWHQAVLSWIRFDWITSSSQHEGYTLLVTGLAIAVVIPIAAASWYLVERPALGLKDRLTRRLRSV